MYKVERYKEEISLKDSETQKRFNLIAKLSKNFKIENAMALEMDTLLAEQIELESTSDVKPADAIKTASSKSVLDKQFMALYEALKQSRIESPVSKEAVEAEVKRSLKNFKVGIENLEPSLKEAFNSKPRVIRYELPEITTPEFSKPPIKEFQMIVDDTLMGNNVFLVGGAGTGKTFMAEHLIAKTALSRKHITINCSQWTSPTEIIGGQTMDGYVEGKLIEAWQNGYVLILDELPKIDPNTAGLFNDALSKTKTPKAVIFNARKESFVKHKDFACIANGNIYPDKESMTYGANNKQDLSLLDRFSGSVYFIEKNPAIEKEIVQNTMIWSICDRIRSVIEEMRYEAQLSLRFMQNARDSFMLEMKRLKGANGITADEGKTFRVAIDSFLAPFTEVQKKNIKEKIRYNEIFSDYQYRTFEKEREVY